MQERSEQKNSDTPNKVRTWSSIFVDRDGYLVVSQERVRIRVVIDQIIYITSRGDRSHLIRLFLRDGEMIECSGTLNSAAELLKLYGFVRIQKSFIVLSDFVEKYSKTTFWLRNGMEIEIGRGYGKQAVETMESDAMAG